MRLQQILLIYKQTKKNGTEKRYRFSGMRALFFRLETWDHATMIFFFLESIAHRWDWETEVSEKCLL